MVAVVQPLDELRVATPHHYSGPKTYCLGGQAAPGAHRRLKHGWTLGTSTQPFRPSAVGRVVVVLSHPLVQPLIAARVAIV